MKRCESDLAMLQTMSFPLPFCRLGDEGGAKWPGRRPLQLRNWRVGNSWFMETSPCTLLRISSRISKKSPENNTSREEKDSLAGYKYAILNNIYDIRLRAMYVFSYHRPQGYAHSPIGLANHFRLFIIRAKGDLFEIRHLSRS